MRLTCRPPERTKTKTNDLHHHQRMTAIPIPSMTSNLPPSPSLTTTPVTLAPTSPQFFSAPPIMTRDQQQQQLPSPQPIPYRTSSPPLPSRPSQNDILKRIVKADDGIKKKPNHHHNHVNKGVNRATIIPPPPLSKYKRPPPIVPHRPGERYPLGIPYSGLKKSLC